MWQSTWQKLLGALLFVAVLNAPRSIKHRSPGLFSHLQQVSGVQVFHVEGWVFAHQHKVKIGDGQMSRIDDLIPMLQVVKHFDLMTMRKDFALLDIQAALLDGKDFPAPGLGRKHHRQGAVFLGV